MSSARRSPRVRDEDRAREKAMIEALFRVYAEVDLLLDGVTCDASTDCCRFAVTGREPYVTSIEIAAMQRALAARGGARSFGPAPAARSTSLPVVRDEAPCPLLTAQGKCAVYAARPLGCRTFFCARARHPDGSPVDRGRAVPQRALNDLVRRVQQLAAAHAPHGDQGRPLTRAWSPARR